MPHELQRRNGLYLGNSKGKGRGLFCSSLIEKGAVIESTPVILFNETDAKHIDKTGLYNYYFSASFLDEAACRTFGITDATKSGILAMGILSFCNHSDASNAKVRKIVEDGIITFSLEAIKDIAAGEEITISYGKLWFEPVKE